MQLDTRWKQRFSNFTRAFLLLKEIRDIELDKFSQLEKEGIIQRFEYTLELSWKTLKDKMEDDGIILDIISPKSIIREAFNSKYIDDIDVWFKMIADRNLMSHTYDFLIFEKMIVDIQKEYIYLFEKFYNTLKIIK